MIRFVQMKEDPKPDIKLPISVHEDCDDGGIYLTEHDHIPHIRVYTEGGYVWVDIPIPELVAWLKTTTFLEEG